MTQDARFYAVCNARYLPSLVALLNSLLLTGHHELVVGDCGLTPDQRERLAPHCTIFPIPPDHARDPVLFKPFAHLMAPTGVVVIIDSDRIVTGSLDLTGRLVLEVMHAVHRLVTTVVRRWPVRIVEPWLIAQLQRRSLARRALERREPPVTRDA